jgi:hypothetical protein
MESVEGIAWASRYSMPDSGSSMLDCAVFSFLLLENGLAVV